MTTLETLQEINKMHKPYAQVGMTQSTFRNTVIAIKSGTAKPDTTEKFFNKFGFTKIKQEEQWEK